MSRSLIGELVLLTGAEKGMGLFLHAGQFYLVGAMSSCDLGLDGAGVAERHCRIMVGSGLVTIEDLRSGEGTLVNGQRVQLTSLEYGDHIRCGDQVVRLDERSDAFAPPLEILEPGGVCESCKGPIVVGEFGHPDVYKEVDGRLCSPCAEQELAGSGRLILSSAPSVTEAGDEPAVSEEIEREVVGGRYALMEKVGAGQLGTVYEAWDGRGETTVALKILDRRFQEDPEASHRLIQMAQKVIHLEHPWVARPMTIGDDPAGLYMASEFVEGDAIWERLDTEGPFDIDLAYRIGIALSDALELIHVKGMVHGDLKPSNLLVVAEDKVKITDVGIARACLGTGLAVVTEKLIPRTLGFHAPELLVEERAADVRSDVYSLGAVLYCLLSGDHPFAEGDDEQLARRIVLESPVPIRRKRPEVDERLEAVLVRAMHKLPGERFESAGAMGQAIMEAWLA